MNDIPGFEEFATIQPVEKGWSNDRKFLIETVRGDRLLLRLSDSALYERKKEEFEGMVKVAELGIPMSKPLHFGVCSGGKEVYGLFTWCRGEDAETALPRYGGEKQFELGKEAGRILKTIHAIQAPATCEEWAAKFARKTANKIETYLKCGYTFAGAEEAIAYLQANTSILEKRPQTYHHGDYHIGNMIIGEDSRLQIIDFNRWDYGDPWEEFNRIVWSAEVSPAFATGQILGYFGKEPPELFFRLLAFYMASNTLSSVYWAIQFSEDEVMAMIEQSERAVGWFDRFRNPVPSWYLSGLA